MHGKAILILAFVATVASASFLDRMQCKFLLKPSSDEAGKFVSAMNTCFQEIDFSQSLQNVISGNNAESRHRRPTFGGNNGGFLGLFNTTDSNPFENFNSVNLTLPTDIAQFLSNLFSGNFPFQQQRQFGGRPQFGGGRPTFGRPPFGGGRPTFGGGRPPFFGVLSNGTNPFANLTTSSVNVTVPSDIAQLLANLFGSGNIGFQFGQQRQFGGPQGFGGQQSFGGQSFGRPQGFGGQQNSGRPQGFGGQRPPFGNQQGGFFGIFSNATNATNNPFAGLSSGTIDLSQLASLFQNFAGRSMARFDPAQYLDSLNLGEQATQLKQCIARETDLLTSGGDFDMDALRQSIADKIAGTSVEANVNEGLANCDDVKDFCVPSYMKCIMQYCAGNNETE